MCHNIILKRLKSLCIKKYYIRKFLCIYFKIKLFQTQSLSHCVSSATYVTSSDAQTWPPPLWPQEGATDCSKFPKLLYILSYRWLSLRLDQRLLPVQVVTDLVTEFLRRLGYSVFPRPKSFSRALVPCRKNINVPCKLNGRLSEVIISSNDSRNPRPRLEICVVTVLHFTLSISLVHGIQISGEK